MKIIKRFIMLFVILDNFILNSLKKLFFKTNWVLGGKCKQCGSCCKRILLKMTRKQIESPFFTKLSIKWITWLFDFILLDIDRNNHYLAFTCKHLKPDGKCGNYFWRPNICRNYPLVDYFEEPKLLPECGFKAELRHRV
ncbi:MAG: YkgJ family cysteine cluster protein [Candidatus Margulisbacteria bacterium]|nr:YkgJ family cysteine cluster protein [Candidatus Margulisiibacteriota bacterium]MBU1021288.1 YkgJ family cysteine cluster protein [Candidatus Margulisiibacteriota bacterium]MBU1729223.1 YkgJ family cysteine cluster protein [Candidatus Margulisiibacteriota bacterium]MBU1954896.1 YkgJ family cysteine cluster protein [Candidatus Margulisiibacteriota bacterium]